MLDTGEWSASCIQSFYGYRKRPDTN